MFGNVRNRFYTFGKHSENPHVRPIKTLEAALIYQNEKFLGMKKKNQKKNHLLETRNVAKKLPGLPK